MEHKNSPWLIFDNLNEDDDCESSSGEEDQNEFESKEFQQMSSNLLTNESEYLSKCIRTEIGSVFENNNQQTVKIKKRWTKEEVT
jgi:hypothetical protein